MSEEFLAEVRGMRRRNLAVELLQKLLRGELVARRRKNVVQPRSFAQLLEQTIRRYQTRAIEAAQVIEELIALARELREATARGVVLGLSDDELAFFDALGLNDSAVQVLGDETLRDIVRELVQTVRSNVTIDWTIRENVRANLRRLVSASCANMATRRTAGVGDTDGPGAGGSVGEMGYVSPTRRDHSGLRRAGRACRPPFDQPGRRLGVGIERPVDAPLRRRRVVLLGPTVSARLPALMAFAPTMAIFLSLEAQ